MIWRRSLPCGSRTLPRRAPTAWRDWRHRPLAWRAARAPWNRSLIFDRKAQSRRGPPRGPPGRRRKRTPVPASFRGGVLGLGRGEAVVAGPFEAQRAAFGGNGGKGQERIGGNRREQLGAEDFLSVIFADEVGDDVAWHRLACIVGAKAGLHVVRDQRFDLDDFAAFGLRRRIDEGTRHGQTPSRQAASVTMTSASLHQNQPSLMCAMAMTLCESARRMRVDTVARPERGPS